MFEDVHSWWQVEAGQRYLLLSWPMHSSQVNQGLPIQKNDMQKIQACLSLTRMGLIDEN